MIGRLMPPEAAATKSLESAVGSAKQAMLNLLTALHQRPSRHRAGRAGQKVRAKARRRGSYGKAVRRRQLAARRAKVKARSAWIHRTRIVIAGNEREYHQWRRKHGIKPSDRSVIYASSAARLRGYSGVVEIVTVGTWLERKDLREIADTVAVIQATRPSR